jgi:hypothetical protein
VAAFCSMCGPKFCAYNISQHALQQKVHDLREKLQEEGKIGEEMVVPK